MSFIPVARTTLRDVTVCPASSVARKYLPLSTCVMEVIVPGWTFVVAYFEICSRAAARKSSGAVPVFCSQYGHGKERKEVCLDAR